LSADKATAATKTAEPAPVAPAATLSIEGQLRGQLREIEVKRQEVAAKYDSERDEASAKFDELHTRFKLRHRPPPFSPLSVRAGTNKIELSDEAVRLAIERHLTSYMRSVRVVEVVRDYSNVPKWIVTVTTDEAAGA
jgi:hypothetical protein